MLLHLRLVLHLALIFITFTVGITFAVVITFSGETYLVPHSSCIVVDCELLFVSLGPLVIFAMFMVVVAFFQKRTVCCL